MMKKILSEEERTGVTLVMRIAREIKQNLPPEVLIEDMFQDGWIGFMDARKNHDPSQGATFESYAGIRIRGEILCGLRKTWNTTRSIARFKRKIEEASWALRQDRNDRPTDTEIAERLGMSITKFNEWLSALSHTGAAVVDFQDEDEYPENLEKVAELSHLRTPEEVYLQEERTKIIQGVLGVMEPLHRQVVFFYDSQELLLRQIGMIMGVSESRVCQIYSKAIKTARKRLRLSETNR